eukprot:2737389-Lingulodinium_polyedra.AAC.1
MLYKHCSPCPCWCPNARTRPARTARRARAGAQTHAHALHALFAMPVLVLKRTYTLSTRWRVG